jgi:hypothetical protein
MRMLRTSHLGRWIPAAVVAGLSLAACGGSGGETETTGPASVEEVAGSDIPQVTLTEEAAKRIDLQTAAVESGTGNATQIPYSALLYDPEGNTWAFVKASDLTFERAAVTVDHIDGDTAFLSDGPEAGTDVVTVGATQLYGAEQGVGEDE